jgi:hypothetical protein
MMPGGRRVWSAFEILEAADVNQYLSDQAVMRFADATARSTALPTPSTGMITALVSESGRPEYWNGSAWIPVEQGVPIPNVLASLNPLNISSLDVGNITTIGSFVEYSAGLADDAVIYGASVFTDQVIDTVEIGTGAAASEVVRFFWEPLIGASRGSTTPTLYPVYVPAGKRIAVRIQGNLTAGVRSVRLFYATVTAGAEVEEDMTTAVSTSGTAWVEIGASPPKAGGVEVVAYIYRNANRTPPIRTIQFGFGASGSEVVATAPVMPATNGGWIPIPPFTWPPSTRLAARSDGASTSTVSVVWRESL